MCGGLLRAHDFFVMRFIGGVGCKFHSQYKVHATFFSMRFIGGVGFEFHSQYKVHATFFSIRFILIAPRIPPGHIPRGRKLLLILVLVFYVVVFIVIGFVVRVVFFCIVLYNLDTIF